MGIYKRILIQVFICGIIGLLIRLYYQENINNISHENSKLRNELESSNSRIDQLKRRGNSMQISKNNYMDIIIDLYEELNSVELNDLQLQSHEVNLPYDENINDKEKAFKRINDIKQKINEQQKKIENLFGKNNEYTKLIRNLKVTLKEKENQINKLTSDNQHLLGRNNNLTIQNEKQEDTIEKQKEQILNKDLEIRKLKRKSFNDIAQNLDATVKELRNIMLQRRKKHIKKDVESLIRKIEINSNKLKCEAAKL